MDEQGLLSLRLVKSRDYYECKKNVDELMYKFEEYKYGNHEILPPKITQSFEIRYESFTSHISNPTETYIQRKLDLEKEINDFYEELANAMKTLCREELIYFKNTYYNRITEESICDILNMSRDSLRRIKESCIVKIAMYYKIDVLATNKG